MTPLTREALLLRAIANDSEALNELLRLHRPYVHMIVRGIRGYRQNGVENSDVVQDALLAAFRSFENFRGSHVGAFVAWLRVIAVRTSQQALGGDRHKVESLEPDALADSGATPLERLVQIEQSAEVAAAVERLPEAMREVILARHLDQLPHAEIADRLNSTPGAVRILYMRALQRLREELKPA